MGGSSLSAFELRAAGGNEKKKSPNNKTLPKRGGFKKLRKPPTVKQWGSVKLSPSLHLFIPAATRHNPGAVPTRPPVPNRGQAWHTSWPAASRCRLRTLSQERFKGNSDLGRLVCHCGEAAGQTPAKRSKRCYSIPKRPRSVTSPPLPQFVTP